MSHDCFDVFAERIDRSGSSREYKWSSKLSPPVAVKEKTIITTTNIGNSQTAVVAACTVRSIDGSAHMSRVLTCGRVVSSGLCVIIRTRRRSFLMANFRYSPADATFSRGSGLSYKTLLLIRSISLTRRPRRYCHPFVGRLPSRGGTPARRSYNIISACTGTHNNNTKARGNRI